MTKSKEAALLEAEKEVHLAKVRVAHVNDLQNRNQELVKQNEICQVNQDRNSPNLFTLLSLVALGKVVGTQTVLCSITGRV